MRGFEVSCELAHYAAGLRRQPVLRLGRSLRARLLRVGLRLVGIAAAAVCVFAAAGCGGPSSPGSMTTGVVSGSVTDRVAGAPAASATITFTGPTTVSAPVVGGGYRVTLPQGTYDVRIAGPSNVTHETQVVYVIPGHTYPFSVLQWGSGRFGATIDDTFVKYFDQLARVWTGGPIALRKWLMPPTEFYVVTGTVPDEQLDAVLGVLHEINTESVPAMWCGLTGPLPIITGPASAAPVAGSIVVRPNWDGPANGGPPSLPSIQGARININVFRSHDQRLSTHDELKANLAHEVFHAAFAFHICGGGLGPNPFGFSPTNCPYPDSLMANRGDIITAPSPQDRLAACIVYNPDTHAGNTYPDTNPTYWVSR